MTSILRIAVAWTCEVELEASLPLSRHDNYRLLLRAFIKCIEGQGPTHLMAPPGKQQLDQN